MPKVLRKMSYRIFFRLLFRFGDSNSHQSFLAKPFFIFLLLHPVIGRNASGKMLDEIGKRIIVDSSKVPEAKAIVAGIKLAMKSKWSNLMIIENDSQIIALDIKKRS
ncbi:hypothetical protein PVK06_005739 [Gossypium arboreum]|uniref:RNase H type-1 domain-containing protein n=1 Tax=Gossypium arboreum TaxID=29729 RepID=A0ABR0QWN3_GOSAR|nr:hypothetical protein PVK06_005739 [Gossypium arboreum]